MGKAELGMRGEAMRPNDVKTLLKTYLSWPAERHLNITACDKPFNIA